MGSPPEAIDKNAVGTAAVAATPGPAYKWGYWYTKFIGYTRGWVKLEVYKGGSLFDCAFYRLYRIYLIEDDQGDPLGYYKGFDPRYGGTSIGTQFLELGGPYDRGKPLREPPAEDIFGYDDRFGGLGVPWTGQPAGRTLHRMPEAQLFGNSLMANTRNHQTIRVYLQGPREPYNGPRAVLALLHEPRERQHRFWEPIGVLHASRPVAV
jgi:hypothetical protein